MSKSKRLKPRPAVRFDAAAIASGKAKVPAAALRFEADVDINDAGGDGNIPVTVRARSGNVLKHWYWGAIVHDFAGMRAASAQLPFDYCHREDEVLGYSDQQDVSSGELVMTGVLIPFKAEDRVDEITHKSANGFQYQASIYFDPDELILEYVPEGFTAAVNDGQVEGPCIIARQWMLRGAALCPYGKDPNTSAQFSASQPGDEVAVCFQEPGSQEPSAMTTKKTKLSAAKPNRHERRKAAALSA
ncbi:MAG: hypothetical protein QOH21_3637, partial [Acidobacteriota bacterium]|nr:hypothetical protein [Acidobacteriota bacterium]